MNVWVQTLGIIVASVWAAYTFIYKEITIPKSAPINISINMKVNKYGLRADNKITHNKPLRAIALEASVTNPSSRTVELLPTIFIVWGLKYENQLNVDFDKNLAGHSVVEPYSGFYWVRHSQVYGSKVIAIGNFIRDHTLKPGETIKRTILMHVPEGEYDAFEASAVVPSTRDTTGLALEWRYSQTEGLIPTLYRVEKDGMKKEMKKDESGGYSDKRLELQSATWNGTFSLW